MTEEDLRSATSTPIPNEDSEYEKQSLKESSTEPSAGGSRTNNFTKTHNRTSSKTKRPRRPSTPRGGSRPPSRTRNELDSLPPYSSAQVFRNLLVLEESLRIQYKDLSLSRRKHIIFFSFLLTAMLYFLYAVFLSPSIYRLFSFLQRVGFLASTITMGLFYLTGLYTKTFVEYPRFIYSTNKGLRPYNLKLVKTPKNWKERFIGLFWDPSYMAQPGRLIKVVLSTRVFTPETIEGWEIYRQEYWERELERVIKRQQQQHQRNSSADNKIANSGAAGSAITSTTGHRKRPSQTANVVRPNK